MDIKTRSKKYICYFLLLGACSDLKADPDFPNTGKSGLHYIQNKRAVPQYLINGHYSRRGPVIPVKAHSISSFAEEESGDYAFLLVFDKNQKRLRFYSYPHAWEINRTERLPLLKNLIALEMAAERNQLEATFSRLKIGNLRYRPASWAEGTLYLALRKEAGMKLADRGFLVSAVGNYKKGLVTQSRIQILGMDTNHLLFQQLQRPIRSHFGFSDLQSILASYDKEFIYSRAKILDYSLLELQRQQIKAEDALNDRFVFRQMVNGLFPVNYFGKELASKIRLLGFETKNNVTSTRFLDFIKRPGILTFQVKRGRIGENDAAALEKFFGHPHDFERFYAAFVNQELAYAFFQFQKITKSEKSFSGEMYQLRKGPERDELLSHYESVLKAIKEITALID